MQITLKLFASLRTGRFNDASRDFPDHTRIADVICSLAIPAAEIGIILLNNRHADPDHQLQDGDRLALFPLVGGG